jgi:hypothetical protein
MLLAEGTGQFLLAYSTWKGDSTATTTKEFVGESERWRKWVGVTEKGKRATPRHIVVTAVVSSFCFNVVIPFCRMLLCAWALKGGYRLAYGVTALLFFEWLSWALTWRRPLFPVVLLLFVGSSLAAGYALYTSDAGLHTHYWGLSNLLYIANFVFFPLGARRWMLEITNIPIWLLLAWGSLFSPEPSSGDLYF